MLAGGTGNPVAASLALSPDVLGGHHNSVKATWQKCNMFDNIFYNLRSFFKYLFDSRVMSRQVIWAPKVHRVVQDLSKAHRLETVGVCWSRALYTFDFPRWYCKRPPAGSLGGGDLFCWEVRATFGSRVRGLCEILRFKAPNSAAALHIRHTSPVSLQEMG